MKHRYLIWHDYADAHVGVNQANVCVEVRNDMDFIAFVKTISIHGLVLSNGKYMEHDYWVPVNRIIRVEYLGTID